MKKIKDEDMIGKRFGRLTVIKRGEEYYTKCGKHYDTWICECDCKSIKTIAGRHLRAGRTKSCGCILKEGTRKTHGMAHTKLHNTWCNMKSRCNNKNNNDYTNYGERGIKVCEEWDKSFEAFYNWAMENGYSENLTIDRIDVNGNYCPENCRWVTWNEQARNKRVNHFITYNGKTMCVKDWETETGINSKTIARRIDNYGWSIERALTEKDGRKK